MELPARNRYAVAMNASAPIQQVPTHLIAGPLGAGKTTVLRHLMLQRPADESWAVLVNEFGEVGIDAALLEDCSAGVQLAEIPGGCLCCVNGLPFQVGLGRLLRRARPQRLFIEASGLGHPVALMQQLAAPPWQGVLALQPLIMVLDAPRLVAGEVLAGAQQEAVASAGLIVLNKSECLGEADCSALAQRLRPSTSVCSVHGAVSLAQLPSIQLSANSVPESSLPDGPSAPPSLWRSIEDWHGHLHHQGEHTSMGWRIHPGQVFSQSAVQAWLAGFPWLRAKGVLHTSTGWQAFNAVDGEAVRWQACESRRDSRVELIIRTSPDPRVTTSGLESALRAATILPPTKDSRTSQ